MQPLKCASLLLLLGVLLLAAHRPAVATARRDTPMATIDGERRGHGGAAVMNSLSSNVPEPPPPPPPAEVEQNGEEVMNSGRRSKDEAVKNHHYRRFGASSQVHFGGRIPFTADYHSIRRHPPSHN